MDPKGKYNLLLMHDDGAIRGFRMTRAGLRLMVALILLLPVLGGGGLWVGWQAWEHKKQWDQEEQILQRELTDVRVQLDRLNHIERLIQLHEAGIIPDEQQAAPASPESGEEREPDDGEGLTTQSPVQESGVSSSPQIVDEATQNGAVNPELASVDTGQVRVDNVSARLGADRVLRIHLDLHNESGRQVSGKMLFFLLAGEEARHPLPHRDSTFSISRFKKIVANCPVPDSVGEMTNASLLVQVVGTDDTLLLRQLFPISH